MDNLNEKIEEIVKSLMASHDDDESEETVDEYLAYIDSIRFIELITAVESEFAIEIDTADLVQENIKNINAFVTMIIKYLNV
jgi:acyl carrier protein